MVKLALGAVLAVSVVTLSGVASSAEGPLEVPSRIALADEPPPPPKPCVVFTGEARYRSGYEHLVHLVNTCDKPVSCDVSTDVTPEVIKATVAARGTVTVLTRRGSPASTFVAKVRCTLS